MAKYYLIKNNTLLAVLDADQASVVALPLLRAGDSMSLLNEEHAQNLMTNLGLSAAQAIAALGLTDMRASLVKTLFLAPRQIVGLPITADGPTYHLIDFGNYSLWQVDSNQDNLLALHNYFYALAPAQSLGLFAVVQTFGSSFFASAVRTATGMTAVQALARRDRIAAYLESIGFANITALRAATDENAQAAGFVTAIGHTLPQLWAAMVAE